MLGERLQRSLGFENIVNLHCGDGAVGRDGSLILLRGDIVGRSSIGFTPGHHGEAGVAGWSKVFKSENLGDVAAKRMCAWRYILCVTKAVLASGRLEANLAYHN